MQHPDEGTIHSWLDGALPAGEAASVEAHVTTCQSCAAAVAEARGFIAASSRILTALDDVPRGVLPAVPERKRDLRVFWRAAAAMLVVAGGSLVVMREGGSDARVAATAERPAGRFSSSAPVTPEATGPERSVLRSEAAIPQASPAPTGARVDSAAFAGKTGTARATARRAIEPTVGAAGRIGAAVAADAAAPRVAGSQTAPSQTTDAQSPASKSPVSPSVGNVDAIETKVSPLRLVSVERRPGVRRTTYEISPTVTVVLTESESLQLSGVVVSGAQTTATGEIRARGNTALQSPRAVATPAAPPPAATMDSRTGSDSAMSRREAAVAKTAMEGVATGATSAAPGTTITWTEARTGKTLSLTGNLSVERLQEIRLRIERERATAEVKPR